MTVTVPANNSVVLVAADNKRRLIAFQNFDTTNGVTLKPMLNSDTVAPTAVDYYLRPAASATDPGELVIQNSGGDTTLANAEWQGFGSDGSNVDINVNAY